MRLDGHQADSERLIVMFHRVPRFASRRAFLQRTSGCGHDCVGGDSALAVAEALTDGASAAPLNMQPFARPGGSMQKRVKAALLLLVAIPCCGTTAADRHDTSRFGDGSAANSPTDVTRRETSTQVPARPTETVGESDSPRCTERVVRETASPARSNETICERDSDCIISNKDLDNPCNYCWVEPYAISKAAPSRQVGELICDFIGYLCDWPTCPNKFVAVCVQHVCERRPKK